MKKMLEDVEEDDDLPTVDLTQSEAHPIAKGSGGIIPKTAVRKVEVPTSSQGHTKPYRLGLSIPVWCLSFTAQPLREIAHNQLQVISCVFGARNHPFCIPKV